MNIFSKQTMTINYITKYIANTTLLISGTTIHFSFNSLIDKYKTIKYPKNIKQLV